MKYLRQYIRNTLLENRQVSIDTDELVEKLDQYLQSVGGEVTYLESTSGQKLGSYKVLIDVDWEGFQSIEKDLHVWFRNRGYNILRMSNRYIQFDPVAHKQNVNYVGNVGDFKNSHRLFHVTKKSSVQSILRGGLKPSKKSRDSMMLGLGRVYLVAIPKNEIEKSLFHLREMVQDPSFTGVAIEEQILLEIDLNKLHGNIKFYGDVEFSVFDELTDAMVWTPSHIKAMAIKKEYSEMRPNTDEDRQQYMSAKEYKDYKRFEVMKKQREEFMRQRFGTEW